MLKLLLALLKYVRSVVGILNYNLMVNTRLLGKFLLLNVVGKLVYPLCHCITMTVLTDQATVPRQLH